MASPANKKPIMVLYSGVDCIYSHGTRVVLFEKEVECEVRYTDNDDYLEDVAEYNPYGEVPTLVDRELIIYGSRVINEYLDDRLPHPPLMPVDPVNRARARLMIMRFNRDLYKAFTLIKKGSARSEKARKIIRDQLTAMSVFLEQQEYMLGEDFSLADAWIAPLLWRLPAIGVELPAQAKGTLDYADRVFARQSFQTSLTEPEKDIRGIEY
ncbi:MAG: stringent starvation protein A [Gammaproteobacteria bacterium]|nr:MAG: stringent starvation protein A [Gammaproteobacteria bacterium]RTZ60260.1 MAG: stringent starvation protein A [Gammaproteobacteria bacterium]